MTSDGQRMESKGNQPGQRTQQKVKVPDQVFAVKISKILKTEEIVNRIQYPIEYFVYTKVKV